MVRLALIASLTIAGAVSATAVASTGEATVVERAESGKLFRRFIGPGLGLGGPLTGQMAVSSVTAITNQIMGLQSGWAGGLAPGLAIQQLQSICGPLQGFLSQFVGWGGAGAALPLISPAFHNLFIHIQQLVVLSQSVFGGGWNNIFSTAWAPLAPLWPNFFQFSAGIGMAPGTFLPGGFSSFFQQCGFGNAFGVLNRLGFK